MEEPDPLRSILNILKSAERITFLTGAGISKESGIPTFRDKDGYWSKYNPETLASMEGFLQDPALVWRWYRERLQIISKARPNRAHLAIKELENYFDVVVITQNVDDLHNLAGSSRVLELHGNIKKSRCIKCGKKYYTMELKGEVPECEECGALVRPDVVWFGEPLDENVLRAAYERLNNTDVLFVVGTSCQVYPAAYFPYIVKDKGGKVVEINIEATPLTQDTDFFLQGPASHWLNLIVKGVRNEL